ncbi:hypothetical protein [Demequina litorisediminis]|uniref:hypothetical protein n=1 Tax=Demequina litorisediminis TaxID=1849022 RepID=UPI0024E05D3A|nr:hypothetical protein [Demequina litorisediminis]
MPVAGLLAWDQGIRRDPHKLHGQLVIENTAPIPHRVLGEAAVEVSPLVDAADLDALVIAHAASVADAGDRR